MPVDVIATLGCHLVTYLRDPRARKASVFMLTFEVGVCIYIIPLLIYGHKNVMEGETANSKGTENIGI